MMTTSQNSPSKSTVEKLVVVSRLAEYLRGIGVTDGVAIATEVQQYSARHLLGLPESLVREVATFVAGECAVAA